MLEYTNVEPAALATAVILGKKSNVMKSLEKGVDPDDVSDFGSPLAIASKTGQFQIVQLSLKHGQISTTRYIRSTTRNVLNLCPACGCIYWKRAASETRSAGREQHCLMPYRL